MALNGKHTLAVLLLLSLASAQLFNINQQWNALDRNSGSGPLGDVNPLMNVNVGNNQAMFQPQYVPTPMPAPIPAPCEVCKECTQGVDSVKVLYTRPENYPTGKLINKISFISAEFGDVLGVPFPKTPDSFAALLQHRSNADYQLWDLIPQNFAGRVYYILRSVWNNRILSVQSTGQLVTVPATGQPRDSQIWYFTESSKGRFLLSSYAYQGSFLNVVCSSTNVCRPFMSNERTEWIIHSITNEVSYYIRHTLTKKVIETSAQTFTNKVVDYVPGAKTQLFHIYFNNQGTIIMNPLLAPRVLDVEKAVASPNINVISFPLHGDANQRWSIQYVPGKGFRIFTALRNTLNLNIGVTPCGDLVVTDVPTFWELVPIP